MAFVTLRLSHWRQDSLCASKAFYSAIEYRSPKKLWHVYAIDSDRFHSLECVQFRSDESTCITHAYTVQSQMWAKRMLFPLQTLTWRFWLMPTSNIPTILCMLYDPTTIACSKYLLFTIWLLIRKRMCCCCVFNMVADQFLILFTNEPFALSHRSFQRTKTHLAWSCN